MLTADPIINEAGVEIMSSTSVLARAVGVSRSSLSACSGLLGHPRIGGARAEFPSYNPSPSAAFLRKRLPSRM